MILIYITHPDQDTASQIVATLLERRLIACANFFPVTGMYWWKGEITHAEEIVSIVKTTEEQWEAVKQTVLEVHPYETPCIMKLPAVEANDRYERWIQDQVQ